ncbi:hypothetical protein RMATCC62417_07119 [Rhizopus microsporus]|nr:hypothetical protein RMATCC62417_07119 [Rhizopus microsporus]
MSYWENRKDQALETNINNDARTTISSIQQLVNQNIREKAKNAFCRSSSSPGFLSSELEFPDPTSPGSESPGSESLDPSSSGSASSSSSTFDIPINECSKIHKSKLACPHGPCSDSLVSPSLLSGVYIWNVLSIASSCALDSLCPPFLFFFVQTILGSYRYPPQNAPWW